MRGDLTSVLTIRGELAGAQIIRGELGIPFGVTHSYLADSDGNRVVDHQGNGIELFEINRN